MKWGKVAGTTDTYVGYAALPSVFGGASATDPNIKLWLDDVSCTGAEKRCVQRLQVQAGRRAAQRSMKCVGEGRQMPCTCSTRFPARQRARKGLHGRASQGGHLAPPILLVPVLGLGYHWHSRPRPACACRLQDCPHSAWGVTSCDHSKDVGISCGYCECGIELVYRADYEGFDHSKDVGISCGYCARTFLFWGWPWLGGCVERGEVVWEMHLFRALARTGGSALYLLAFLATLSEGVAISPASFEEAHIQPGCFIAFCRSLCFPKCCPLQP